MIIGALTAGILLDGTLYNKPTPNRAIHPVEDAQAVALYFADQLILGFKKTENSWQQSVPVKAPAHQQRIQVLLDTNKYNQRQYPIADLPQDEIFVDPITLKIDEVEFDFGVLEPVSNLRYVRSGEYVYLQPDSVVPLLNAVNNAFIDLKITDTVQQVTIDDITVEQVEDWTNLTAIDVVDKNIFTPGESSVRIQLMQNNQPLHLVAQHSELGYTISTENDTIYLLGSSKAQSLGLTELLSDAD